MVVQRRVVVLLVSVSLALVIPLAAPAAAETKGCKLLKRSEIARVFDAKVKKGKFKSSVGDFPNCAWKVGQGELSLLAPQGYDEPPEVTLDGDQEAVSGIPNSAYSPDTNSLVVGTQDALPSLSYFGDGGDAETPDELAELMEIVLDRL